MIKPLLMIGISKRYDLSAEDVSIIQKNVKKSLDNDYHVIVYLHEDIKDKKFDVYCAQSEEDIENKSLDHFINKLMEKECE